MNSQYQNYNEESQQQEFEEEATRINALNLKWTVGFNYRMIDGVHNLTKSNRKEIFYCVGHTGVIYDYANNSQRLLQGHCNRITCCAFNKSMDILVTADEGPDSMLIVWDANTGIPKRTIMDPHPQGTQALDIDKDGQYIVTLSLDKQQRATQSITLWEWNAEEPERISNEHDPRITDYQKYIRFNQDNTSEFVTTGNQRIVFWSWEQKEKGFQYYSPSGFKKQKLKFYTQTVYIPSSTQAVTGTDDGNIVVWDISLIMEDYSQPEERKAIKIVNLMNTTKSDSSNNSKKGSSSINILKIEDKYLVIGSDKGSIRFYDFQFRIIAWFEEINVSSITNISFANSSLQDGLELGDTSKPGEGADEEPPFTCPEFIVVDMDAKITKLHSKLFEEIDKNKKMGEVILKSIVAPIVSIAVKPNSNLIAICCENGILYEWNFQEKSHSIEPLKQFNIEIESFPTCIEYSQDGQFLAVATKSGKMHFYDSEGEKDKKWQPTPLDVSQMEKAKPKVSMIIFSSDSKHVATMDDDFAVTLFCYDYKLFDPKNHKEWQYVGKNRVHHAPIRSITFGESLDEQNNKFFKIFSVSEDMTMCEFDIIEIDYSNMKATQQANIIDRLKLKSVFPIEQEGFPTACIWYPINQFKEDVLLTVNQDYKIKLWHIMKNGIKICKKTCLGPTYGGAINKLLVLNPNDAQNDYQDKYLAYSTKEKVVGIIKLPLDGNPNQTMGLIAHPDKITGITSTSDGKLFFTSGYDDYAVNIWSVNVSALEEAFFTDPNRDPYPNLLEGGEDGQTHRDLKDFFYYSQIRSKNEHTTKARNLDGKVPLRAIPDMMMSMGHYPSQKEIENMITEIKFSEYLEHGKYVDELDLNIFLRLFVNHRPVYGIGKQQIIDALNILGEGEGEQKGTLSRDQLLSILKNEGEKMNDEEIKMCFETLLGEGGELPETITPDILIDDILGFEDLEGDKKEENNQDNAGDEDAEENQEEGQQ